MKKVTIFFCAVFMVIALLIACSAVFDITKARKIEIAVSGGYESLLAYENRENSDTFVSPEAYVQEKSLHYQREADSLYKKAGSKLISSLVIAVLDAGIYFMIKNKRKTNYDK